MILNKRVFRELKNNPFKYFALFFIVILSVSMVCSLASSTDSIDYTTSIYQNRTNVEDGNFSLYTPLNNSQVENINEKGFDIEKQYYVDISFNNGELRIFSFRNKINKIEILKGRKSISDKEVIIEQKYADENNYKINDSINIAGKNYTICGIGCVPDYIYPIKNLTDLGTNNKKFGLIFVSDNTLKSIVKDSGDREIYQYSYKKINSDVKDSELKDYLIDLECDKELITDTYLKNLYKEAEDFKNERDDSISTLLNGSNKLSNGLDRLQSGANELANSLDSTKNAISSLNIPELAPLISSLEAQKSGSHNIANSAYQLKKGSNEISNGIKIMGDDITEITDELYDIDTINLSSFIKKDNNKRINAASDDAALNKTCGLYVGIFAFALIAFMFSVFASHNVDTNSEIVGTLYAMGYKKKELVKHFLILPILVVLLGSIIGLIFTYFLTKFIATGNVTIYSYPPLKIVIDNYLIVYGLFMPNIFTIVINYFILSIKLNQKPLSLLRKEKKVKKSFNISLNKFTYMTSYKIRQVIREWKTFILMFIGMGLSILLMVWGLSIYGAVTKYTDNIEKNVPNKYTYLLANPLEDIPEKGEEAYIKSAETKFYITDDYMNVTIMGVKDDSEYFTFSDKLKNDKNYIAISDSASKKFGYKKGDVVILHDELEDKNYCVTISDIVPYSNGLYFFMNVDAMRKLSNVPDDYYNTIISNNKLDIDENMLLSLVSTKELSDVGNKMLDIMMNMLILMIVISVILFCCVMYLLMKIIIDRSSFSISLLKIFGYNDSEVKKLYLNSTFIIILMSIFISVPISKLIVDLIFPATVSDIESYMGGYLSPCMYGFIIGLILLSYFVVYILLYRKISKISYTEILKKRD